MATKLESFEYPSPEVLECPYPFMRALHDEAPVYRLPGRNDYFVSAYDDVVYVAKHPEIFSNHREDWLHHAPPDIAEILKAACPFEPAMAYSDPPENAKYRSAASKVVSAARLKQAAPAIERIVNSLIDNFVDREECELMEEFANHVPAAVVCYLLGLPDEDVQSYRIWTNDFAALVSGMLGPEEAKDAARSVVALHDALIAATEERRLRPREDGLSDMVTTVLDDGVGFTTPEIVSMCTTLITGGQSTTAHSIGNAMLLLLERPEQMERVLKDPSIIPRVVEEVIRVESPAQWIQRIVTADTELRDVRIPKGARVLVYFGAANRDESRFPNANVLDVDRENLSEHVAFGHGVHRCLGAPLARMELRITLEALLSRVRNIRLKPGVVTGHLPHPIFRAPSELHLQFEKA